MNPDLFRKASINIQHFDEDVTMAPNLNLSKAGSIFHPYDNSMIVHRRRLSTIKPGEHE